MFRVVLWDTDGGVRGREDEEESALKNSKYSAVVDHVCVGLTASRTLACLRASTQLQQQHLDRRL